VAKKNQIKKNKKSKRMIRSLAFSQAITDNKKQGTKVAKNTTSTLVATHSTVRIVTNSLCLDDFGV
jgi:hypothetical protein